MPNIQEIKKCAVTFECNRLKQAVRNLQIINKTNMKCLIRLKSFLFSGMKKSLLLVVAWPFLLVSCKKNNVPPQHSNKQLFPLTKGNQWVYVDSFFDVDGAYTGIDTFHLQTTVTVVHNNQSYTPISDQYEQAVFTVRSNDSSVFLWKPPGEVLLFNVSLPATVPYINNSYFGDTLNSIIYTNKISTMGYPSYHIVVTQDDGLWYHYVQDEYFFSIGIGIIKGITRWKNNNNEVYTSDSYRLIYYYVQ